MELLPEDTEVHHSPQYLLTEEQIPRNIANTEGIRGSGALLCSDNTLPTFRPRMPEIYLAADNHFYLKDNGLRLSRRAILSLYKKGELAVKKCAKADEGGEKQTILRSLW